MGTREDFLPTPPVFPEELVRHCRATRDFRPILFEWYKFVGRLVAVIAHIQRESPAFRPIPATHYHVLIGLINRCARLMLSNVALSHEGRFGETTAIVDRCIFESAIKILWLLKDPIEERFSRYLADGLKTEVEFKGRIQSNIADRSGMPLPIETRMLQSIYRHIAAAGLTEETVISTKKLPNLASMIDSLGLDRLLYIVGQKIGSHHVHGTWPSLLLHYLEEQDGNGDFQFAPRGHHCSTHADQYVFIPLIVLQALCQYVSYVFDSRDYVSVFINLFQSTEDEIRSIYSEVTREDE